MISKEIQKLARSIIAKRSIYYHGTSKENLRRILKEGLLPAGWKNVKLKFDNESPYVGYSNKTFGGVYLTKKLRTAIAYSNKELIVETSIESGSPGILLDEDNFNKFLDNLGFGKNFIDDLNDQFKFRTQEVDIYSIEKIITYINNADFDQTVNSILRSMKKDFHLDLSRDVKMKKQLLDQVIRSEMIHLLEGEYNRQFELGYINFPKPDRLKNTYTTWRDSVDKFLKLFPKTISQSGMNIRFPGPITYRGKNRITGIMLFGRMIRNQELDLYGRILYWVYGDGHLIDTYCKMNDEILFIYRDNKLIKVMRSGETVDKNEYLTIFHDSLERLNLL